MRPSDWNIQEEADNTFSATKGSTTYRAKDKATLQRMMRGEPAEIKPVVVEVKEAT